MSLAGIVVLHLKVALRSFRIEPKLYICCQILWRASEPRGVITSSQETLNFKSDECLQAPGRFQFVHIHVFNQIESLYLLIIKIKMKVYHFRCLCELAKQIGFTPNALDVFKLDRTLGMYRQVVSFLKLLSNFVYIKPYVPFIKDQKVILVFQY